MDERRRRLLQNGRINLRVTEDELADVKGQAALAGLSLSEYVRRRVLGITVTSKVDVKMYNELNKLGGLVKHIFNESGGTYSDKTREALEALTSCARRIERQLFHDRKDTAQAP